MDSNTLIPLDKAKSIILKHAGETSSEKVNFTDSLHRVLAEDIVSSINMPPFDKSAMDGYACRMRDIENDLEVIETIPAGKSPLKEINANQCSKIMTGAPVPKGADCVVMQEDTQLVGNKVKIVREPGKTNICYLGEDIKEGNIVLERGLVIKPQHISLMASLGHTHPLVYKKPHVSILVTGNEIVEPDINPGYSKIRNSNGYQLIGQITTLGCIPLYKGIVKDDTSTLSKTIINAFEKARILIITGGASKGDYDLVPPVLEKLGFTIHFKQVAIQPGKPVCFATKKNLLCFGLSGNPVSSFIQFELLVKPFILKLTGVKTLNYILKLKLDEEVTRKKTQREYFFPVKISENYEAAPIEFHGSAHISAFTVANGIASIKTGIKKLEKGEWVDVRPV